VLESGFQMDYFVLVHRHTNDHKSLTRHTSRFILFDGDNIYFDVILVIYRNSTEIPPIIIINRIYEHQNLLSLYFVYFLAVLRTYQHPCTYTQSQLAQY
jgi:hypothetical protein